VATPGKKALAVAIVVTILFGIKKLRDTNKISSKDGKGRKRGGKGAVDAKFWKNI